MNKLLIDKIDIKSLSAGGFEKKYDGVYHKKILDCLSIVQAVDGSYDIKLNGGQTFSTGKGGVFVAPSHTLQEITHHDGDSGIMSAQWVFIDAIINEVYRFDEILSFPVILDKKYNDEIYSLIFDIKNGDNTFTKMQRAFRLLEILFEQSSIKKQKNSIKTRLENFVKNNYSQDIKASDIARHLACSISQVFKYTQKFYSLSPANYINGIRLQQAEKLLVYSDKNIIEISCSVGFSDSAYFSKLFKRSYGHSPQTYRKLYANL
jgi:AraC-like DNA-binding protein